MTAADEMSLVDKLGQCAERKVHFEISHAAGLVHRAAASIMIESHSTLPSGVYVTLLHGGLLFVDVRDYVGRELFIHQAHEPDVSAFLARSLKPGDCFVDVGAHFGYFSHLAAHLVGTEGAVLAVEPARTTLNYLRQNTIALKQVQVAAAAAWRETAELTLQDFGGANSCLNTVAAIRWARSDIPPPVAVQTYVVPAQTVDDMVFTRNLRPTLVKIDVESAERDVLEGMQQVIYEYRPDIIFEVGDIESAQAAGAPSSLELIAHVESLGYKVFDIAADGQPRPFNPPQAGELTYKNLVGRPTR